MTLVCDLAVDGGRSQMVAASNAGLSWLGTQQALQEDWLARDWDLGSS